jgi:hypothetical protein
MNELSIDEQETFYAEYVEYQRNELRKEGAAELRNSVLEALRAEQKWHSATGSDSEQVWFYALQWAIDKVAKL